MPIIKYKNILEDVFKKPVFTSRTLLRKGIPRNYLKLLVHNLVKQGKLYRVEKGVYSTTDDPIVVAGYMSFPSYLSMYIALYLQGALFQVPSIIQVITTRRRKNKKITFLGNTIEFYKIKNSYFFGFEYILYNNFEIPVASVEKAVIDIFYFKNDIVGTIDRDYINTNKLIEYLDIIGIKSLKKRVLRWLKNGDFS